MNENIRHIRQLRNLTQQYLADCLRISHTGYAKMERGEIAITEKRLQQIAKVLQVTTYFIKNFNVNKIFNE